VLNNHFLKTHTRKRNEWDLLHVVLHLFLGPHQRREFVIERPDHLEAWVRRVRGAGEHNRAF